MSAPASSQPVYLVIRQTIMDRIECGDYPIGSPLPSENDLAAEFDTTRLTVRSAIDALVEHGMVRRIQGKGMFVASRLFGDNVSLGGFRQYAERRHAVAGVRLLGRARRPAGFYYGDVLGVDPADELYVVRRVNSVDGEPVSIERAMIPLKLFPGIEDVDISAFSLYETYEMLGHPVALAQEKLDIEALTARDAGLLRCESGDLALVLESLSFDAQGRPIEYARSLNRGDRGGYTYRY